MEEIFTNLNLSEKEKKILEAAIQLFSKKGFDKATSKEIAKEAKVAEGTIFKYFKTKKDILSAIVVYLIHLLSDKVIFENIKKIINENNDIKIIIKKIIYDRMELIDKIFPMFQIVITQALINQEVRDALFENIIKKGISLISNLYEELVKKDIIKNELDVITTFRSILANVAIFIIQKKLFKDYFNETNLEEEIDKLIDVILYGISKRVKNEKNNFSISTSFDFLLKSKAKKH